MKFEVTILGCGSATPTLRHSPTAQLVNYEEKYFLLDCGEGTQLQLRRFGIKFQRIDHIFITHLHGDHCLGLPGLLSTLHLLGRTKTVHIYSHPDLEEATNIQLKVSYSRLRFEVIWHPLEYKGVHTIYQNKTIEVLSVPLSHRIPTCGFLVREKVKPRNILPEAIEKYQLSVARIRQIKAGGSFTTAQGEIIPNEALTSVPPTPRSYAFITDTAPKLQVAEAIKGVDLLYHESTFLQRDAPRAKDTYHSTAKQAAEIALAANAGHLLLGHFSARYRDMEQFRTEAAAVFPEVSLAYEGQTIPVGSVHK
jgi:ribonuclease Z